jgi:DNA-binding winged helix-turn-helix (wHTH) protein
VGSESSDGVIADLLNYLRSHPGRILSREELAAEVWRAKFFSGSRSIDMAVCLARKRLERRERIVSVRTLGYRYERLAPAAGSKRPLTAAVNHSNPDGLLHRSDSKRPPPSG